MYAFIDSNCFYLKTCIAVDLLSDLIGPILWGLSGPLCQALSLSLIHISEPTRPY